MKLINAIRIVALLATVAGAVLYALQGGLDEIEIHAHQTWVGNHPLLAWAMVSYLFGEAFCLAIRVFNNDPK